MEEWLGMEAGICLHFARLQKVVVWCKEKAGKWDGNYLKDRVGCR